MFLPGKSHGQRYLVGYRPWGCKELDMTEQLNNNSVFTVRLAFVLFFFVNSSSKQRYSSNLRAAYEFIKYLVQYLAYHEHSINGSH